MATATQAGDGRVRGLSLVYPAYYGYLGIVTPYMPLWLADRGFAGPAIAFAGAIVMMATTLGQLALPSTALRLGLRRLTIFVALLAMLLTAAMGAAHAQGSILVLAAASGVFCGALLPLLDGMVLSFPDTNWGRLRACGSLGFAASGIACGFAIDRFGAWTVIAAETFMLGLVLWGSAGVRSALAHVAATTDLSPRRGLGVLVVRKDVWLLMLAVALVNSGHAYYYTFANLHWMAVYGASASSVGLLWAIGVGAEVAVLAFCSGSADVPPSLQRSVKLLLAGAAAGVLRWSISALDPPFGTLLAAQLLHGFTFGATMAGGMQALRTIVAPNQLPAALGLFAGLVHGIVIGSVTLLIGRWSGPADTGGFWFMAIVCLLGGAFAAQFGRVARRQ